MKGVKMVITSVRTAVESRTIVRRFNIATRAGSATRATRGVRRKRAQSKLLTGRTTRTTSGRGFAPAHPPHLAQFVRFTGLFYQCQNGLKTVSSVGVIALRSSLYLVFCTRPPARHPPAVISLVGLNLLSEFAQTSSNSNSPDDRVNLQPLGNGIGGVWFQLVRRREQRKNSTIIALSEGRRKYMPAEKTNRRP